MANTDQRKVTLGGERRLFGRSFDGLRRVGFVNLWDGRVGLVCFVRRVLRLTPPTGRRTVLGRQLANQNDENPYGRLKKYLTPSGV